MTILKAYQPLEREKREMIERVADAMYEAAGSGDAEPIDRNDFIWPAMASAAIEAAFECPEGWHWVMQPKSEAFGDPNQPPQGEGE